MDDLQVEVMLGIIIKSFFYGIYGDCLIMTTELCNTVKCKKGISILKKVHPIMYYIGNDAYILMNHKIIKLNTPLGITILKRMDFRKLVLDAKTYIIDAILYLLEEHPLQTPQVIEQFNKLGGTQART